MSEQGARIPLFPLHTVLFPQGLLLLRIFEARYIDMVRDCMKRDAVFGVVQIHEGLEVGRGAAIHPVGTTARIVDWTQTPDGLLGITVRGERKFRVRDSVEEDSGLLVGDVEWLPEEPETPLPAEFDTLGQLCQRIVSQLGEPFSSMPQHPDRAGWVGARLAEWLPLTGEVKQALLVQDDPLVRLFELRDAMLDARMG